MSPFQSSSLLFPLTFVTETNPFKNLNQVPTILAFSSTTESFAEVNQSLLPLEEESIKEEKLKTV